MQRLTQHPKIFLHSFSDKIFKKIKGEMVTELRKFQYVLGMTEYFLIG